MTLTKAHIANEVFVENIFTKTESVQVIYTLFEPIKQSRQNCEDVLVYKGCNIAPRMLEDFNNRKGNRQTGITEFWKG